MMFVKRGRHFDIYIPRLSVRGLHILTILTKYFALQALRTCKCELFWPWQLFDLMQPLWRRRLPYYFWGCVNIHSNRFSPEYTQSDWRNNILHRTVCWSGQLLLASDHSIRRSLRLHVYQAFGWLLFAIAPVANCAQTPLRYGLVLSRPGGLRYDCWSFFSYEGFISWTYSCSAVHLRENLFLPQGGITVRE